MKVLGINSAYHETSAALIVDGQLLCAVEEERFNRYKHGSEANIDNPDELPVQSIRYCLQQSNLHGDDLDAIGFSFDPQLRQNYWQADPYAQPGGWGHIDGETIFQSRLKAVPQAISNLLGSDVMDRFHWVSHHIAHAASAYYPSQFQKSNILIVDGISEYSTALLAYGEGNNISELETILLPNSIGFLWEKISKFLGFSEYDASKVMGLAGYGNPLVYKTQFEQIIRCGENGQFEINDNLIQFRSPNCDGLTKLFGKIDLNGYSGHSQKSRDIAATLQEINNQVLLGLANRLYLQNESDSLCLAGGVVLNCQSNWVVKERGPYQHLYIPTAPHDGGTSIGAALYSYHQLLPQPIPALADRVTESQQLTLFNEQALTTQLTSISRPKASVISDPYTGPSFTNEAIEEILRVQGVAYRYSENVAQEAAQFIADGNVIGWFQGQMEFGPRALGNRSLLGDPRDSNMREILNHKVKHREPFRPFSPSVLEESADDWFELGKPSKSYYYMLYACPVKQEKAALIPAVLHIDKTGRVQTVSSELNPRYHALISHFADLTGIPMVLNTSFNDSEPIVCTPQDALNTFQKTKIDVLVLGDYIITR